MSAACGHDFSSAHASAAPSAHSIRPAGPVLVEIEECCQRRCRRRAPRCRWRAASAPLPETAPRRSTHRRRGTSRRPERRDEAEARRRRQVVPMRADKEQHAGPERQRTEYERQLNRPGGAPNLRAPLRTPAHVPRSPRRRRRRRSSGRATFPICQPRLPPAKTIDRGMTRLS